MAGLIYGWASYKIKKVHDPGPRIRSLHIGHNTRTRKKRAGKPDLITEPDRNFTLYIILTQY
ncbi:MAG: hypothetical protein DRH37_02150 [Deltaproteobacteria bacterium]|nr:MAG: hypothetical protein DRH37_02150 [Deltaproteobacteria bacterium]